MSYTVTNSPQTSSPSSSAWALFIIVTAIGGAVAGYLLQSEPSRVPVVTATMDAGCDLRLGECRAVLPGGGTVRFSIAPQHVPLFKPLRLDVAVDGMAADAVEVDFAGVDMNMGPNHVRLARTDEGRFTGEGMLPACVRERMAWQATVTVDTDAGRYAAVYLFDTFRGR